LGVTAQAASSTPSKNQDSLTENVQLHASCLYRLSTMSASQGIASATPASHPQLARNDDAAARMTEHIGNAIRHVIHPHYAGQPRSIGPPFSQSF